MKIWVFSDLHVEFGVPFKHLPPEDADVVVCAGDIATKGILPSIEWLTQNIARTIPIVFVAGNHEFYGASFQESIRNAEIAANYPDFHFLENDVVEIDDVTFVGGTLWSDFRLFDRNPEVAMAYAKAGMNDYRRIKFSKEPYRKFQPIHAYRKHQETKAFLATELRRLRGRNTVVVTHHAPSGQSISPEFKDDPLSGCYASNLEDLIVETQPAVWIHGHVHHKNNYRIGETTIVSNPRGYPGESSGFEPELVVEIRGRD
ncbi:metallophosphoesterase [Rhizobium pusense]|uniref:Phosphatase n=1 Tax=Agrobacterium pusense TaxID=648995 RepID=A0A6H0ZPX3_9HYPH|nr:MULTISPECIES: metallophosphoesterase [Agrobacterium]MDH2092424.1 metallophosphoesterase [Agrobacterium pusense]QIX22127.1 phosphatase [Agrobacterium pusense]UXT58721.1 phosphatase [Agrobacterium fabrum]WCK24012.1 metallophosphoesterase [Agrobacterium pusense]